MLWCMRILCYPELKYLHTVTFHHEHHSHWESQSHWHISCISRLVEIVYRKKERRLQLKIQFSTAYALQLGWELIVDWRNHERDKRGDCCLHSWNSLFQQYIAGTMSSNKERQAFFDFHEWEWSIWRDRPVGKVNEYNVTNLIIVKSGRTRSYVHWLQVIFFELDNNNSWQ